MYSWIPIASVWTIMTFLVNLIIIISNNITTENPQFQREKSANIIFRHVFSMEELLSLVIPNRTSPDIDMDPCKVNVIALDPESDLVLPWPWSYCYLLPCFNLPWYPLIYAKGCSAQVPLFDEDTARPASTLVVSLPWSSFLP